MNISDFSIAFTTKTADVSQYNRSVIEHIFYYITHIGNYREFMEFKEDRESC